MNSKNNTAVKLLRKSPTHDQDHEDDEAEPSRPLVLSRTGISVVTAVLLALVLVPGSMLVEEGGTTVRHEAVAGRLGAFFGLTALLLVIFYVFFRYLKRFRPSLSADTKKLLLLALLLFSTVAFSQFTTFFTGHLADKFRLDAETVSFALPVAAGAMLASLLLDFHLALGFSFMVSILLGIALRGDPFIPVYYVLVSIVAALSVIRCTRRTAVLKAGALTGLVGLVVIVCIDLYRGELAARGTADLVAGFLGAVAVTMVVSVTLPFFEALFDIATDIKLLELLDPNHPLLKDLVYKSPGTYHHSILIGNLAEAAAEAINENAILARVGAYYHDIGKIHKPDYYIENQRPTENKHDRLMPSMSSLIIASHVKDGVDDARSHRLPSVVVDIIRQHHGTSLITYFYQKAKELQPYAVIAEEDYRYPGPRPRTKVAAIVMLADSVEAASRALENPTPQRIQALTNSVITRIFLDDQLSRCDLTLKDLRDISQSFNLVLNGIYHHRIDYPGMGLPGDKRRVDHQDKKQPEEKKSAAGAVQGGTRESIAELRPS